MYSEVEIWMFEAVAVDSENATPYNVRCETFQKVFYFYNT